MPGILSAITGLWAMDEASLETLRDQVDMVQGPMDRAIQALSGDRVLQPEISASRAVVRVQGVLMAGVPWWMYYLGLAATDLGELAQVLDELATDHGRISEVVLAINSPGGTVTGTNEAAAAVRRLRASGVRVVAECSGCCCSAAYWIAAQCDSISCGPTTMMGSIGVYSLLMDTTKEQQATGRRLVLVSTGGVKGLGADGAVSPELIAETQERIDTIRDLFVDAVALGRGMARADAAALASGAVWLGAGALSHRLVDSVTDNLTDYGYQSPEDDEDAAAAVAAAHARADGPAATLLAEAQADQSPAATSAAQPPEESPMTPEQMTALIKAHPEHATLIADQFAEKKTEAECALAIAGAERDLRVSAQADAAKASKGQAWDQAGSTIPDPGADGSAEHRAANPLSKEALQANWNAMGPEQQAEYMSFESYSWLATNGKLPKPAAK